jgi:tight adherence protein B
MGLLAGLVFFGIFAIVTLLMIALSNGAAQQAKLARATLEAALAGGDADTHSGVVDLRKAETLSANPWLNRKLLQFELGPRLQKLIDQANIKWTAGGLLAGCAGCAAGAAFLAYLRFQSPLISLLAAALLGSVPVCWVFFKRGKRFSRFLQGLPEALDLMVGAIRAGHSLIAAMGLVGRECLEPVGPEFKICFDEQNYGLEMKAALDNLIGRVPLQELRIVATAIMIQKESGGNLAEVLDKTSHVIRERFRLKREIAVYTAQGRLTGWILTILPIGLGVVLYLSDPSSMSVLWTNPLGIKLLWASGAMMVVGSLIIRKIVNIDM